MELAMVSDGGSRQFCYHQNSYNCSVHDRDLDEVDLHTDRHFCIAVKGLHNK